MLLWSSLTPPDIKALLQLIPTKSVANISGSKNGDPVQMHMVEATMPAAGCEVAVEAPKGAVVVKAVEDSPRTAAVDLLPADAVETWHQEAEASLNLRK